ncbi:hypothetical protein BU25DRAFT_265852 [Macroventuria anomochaeta]|uniref:Uncharacterized protein n=1 Tax=Macroventuria anomochaeta TaxID=301207 RepID=A0ACB6S9B1_9PLEO|nr:uncharacterized protein BU25DRAFT_265852 [Macroventuria anomochaeta]KAF2630117.1 hypothetical protein BU25DRAFT_265852 [Macroventuria anomochaeta]
MRAGLNFIVPIACLLSTMPAALAWSHGSRESGTSKDSDFFQTIAGSALQLLGLVTFIWPTLPHPRLVGQTWWFIWILAIFSAICAVLSISLYLVVPSTWSFAIGFAGGNCTGCCTASGHECSVRWLTRLCLVIYQRLLIASSFYHTSYV